MEFSDNNNFHQIDSEIAATDSHSFSSSVSSEIVHAVNASLATATESEHQSSNRSGVEPVLQATNVEEGDSQSIPKGPQTLPTMQVTEEDKEFGIE